MKNITDPSLTYNDLAFLSFNEAHELKRQIEWLIDIAYDQSYLVHKCTCPQKGDCK